jgi:DNA polymerase-4
MTTLRKILHVDMDAFYASVEQRDNPELRGKPVIVGGSRTRGVVCAASYEARPFGVRSAMPLYKARAACPNLVVVPPDMAKYKNVSREIFAIFERGGRAVEGLSMDEAFVDLGEVSFERAKELAAQIRSEILEGTQLTVSAGVAGGKMTAKIASDACKPNGLLGVPPGEEASFLAPLPIGRLWGIGPKTQNRMTAFGIATIGDLAALDDERVREYFGTWGFEARELARGRDSRRIETDRETKSISTEETFEYDVSDETKLSELLREQARELGEKLERYGLYAGTVGIKITRADFSKINRQVALSQPSRDPRRLYRAAVYCLQRAELNGTPVRLLGLRVASLDEAQPLQVSLFEWIVR